MRILEYKTVKNIESANCGGKLQFAGLIVCLFVLLFVFSIKTLIFAPLFK